MVFYRKTLIYCDVCGTLCPLVGILCEDMTTVPYAMSTPESMAKAVDEIKASGRKAIGIKCDVRQASYVDAMVNKVMETFGKIEKEIRKNEPDTDEKNLKSLARLRK